MGGVQYNLIQSIDLVNIIKQMSYSEQFQGNPYIIRKKYIRSWHSGIYINFKESIIIRFDIFMDILFAQRGNQSPSDISMDISDFKWHFVINIEYHLLDFSSISGPYYLSIASAINLDIVIKADRFIRVNHLSYICLFKADQFVNVINFEHHQVNLNSISGPSYIFVTLAINLDILIKADRFISAVHPSYINLFNSPGIVVNADRFIRAIYSEYYLLDLGSITAAFNFDIMVKVERIISITQSFCICLLTNLDIDIKAERVIRTFHPDYLYFIKGINWQTSSGDHQQTLKSHREASLMNTSVEHINYVHSVMVKQMGFNIKTVYLYLTNLSILKMVFSKYLITNDIFNNNFQDQIMDINESIIHNYPHTVISVLHQWEALDIIHPCPSRNGTSRSHHIEWRDITFNIIDVNSCDHHPIQLKKPSCCFIKNICIYLMNISIDHQELICNIYNNYIKTIQGQFIISDSNEVQLSFSVIQSIGFSYSNHIIFKKEDYDISTNTVNRDIVNTIVIQHIHKQHARVHLLHLLPLLTEQHQLQGGVQHQHSGRQLPPSRQEHPDLHQ